MDFAAFRESKGWSQAEAAIQFGLKSKGRISDLENGVEIWPTDLAIAIDRLTAGVVTVADLRPDLHDVRVLQPQGAGA